MVLVHGPEIWYRLAPALREIQHQDFSCTLKFIAALFTMKWSEGKSLSRVRLFCDPMDCSLPGSSVHGIFPGKNTGVGCHKKPICPSIAEGIKIWYIYNSVLLSHKNEQIWVSWSELDEPRDCYTEWGRSEGEKQILYINTYMWYLEKQYWWIYLQGRNGDAHVQNGLVDTAKEWEGGTSWESSVSICTLPWVK